MSGMSWTSGNVRERRRPAYFHRPGRRKLFPSLTDRYKFTLVATQPRYSEGGEVVAHKECCPILPFSSLLLSL
jgi:hypothetical protein